MLLKMAPNPRDACVCCCFCEAPPLPPCSKVVGTTELTFIGVAATDTAAAVSVLPASRMCFCSSKNFAISRPISSSTEIIMQSTRIAADRSVF